MSATVAAATILLMLHRPSGAEIVINPDEVTSMYASENKGNITDQARCMINMTDGKFLAVVEDCHEIVNQLINERKKLELQEKVK